MTDWTTPKEHCCQCGRELGLQRWHIAGVSGTARHGPFCSRHCLEASQTLPHNPFHKMSTEAKP